MNRLYSVPDDQSFRFSPANLFFSAVGVQRPSLFLGDNWFWIRLLTEVFCAAGNQTCSFLNENVFTEDKRQEVCRVENGAFMCRHHAVSWWGARRSAALWAAFNNRSMLGAAGSAPEGGVQSTNRWSNEAFQAVPRLRGFLTQLRLQLPCFLWDYPTDVSEKSRHGNRKPG